MDGVVAQVLAFIEANKEWAAVIAFFFALAETTAFLSIVIPSTAILIGVGAIVATGALDFAPLGSAIEIALAVHDGQVVFTLRDHGPGVPDYALPRLGERYFSLPRSSSGQTVRGSGLGLAIAKQVAELHGGGLQFENAQPGLRVTLRLPAVECSPSRSP